MTATTVAQRAIAPSPKKKVSGSDLLVIGVGLFVVVPILATLVAATSVDFSRGPWGKGITLDRFAQAWGPIAPMMLRSLGVAVLVVALNLVLGGFLAWWMPRFPRWVRSTIATMVNIPLAVPGIALSVALVATYPTLRPSGLLLVCGHLVFTLPFTMSALIPALSDQTLMDAEAVATTLGASRLRVTTTITIPWVTVSLLQAATMVFALSFGEFNISFFVNPPATPMAPFALFDAYSTQRLEIASAQSIIFIAFTIPVLAAVVWARRQAARSIR